MDSARLTFATFCDCEDAFRNAITLVSSIRRFAGQYADAGFTVIVPAHQTWMTDDHTNRMSGYVATIHLVEIPPDVRDIFYGDKPFAAARAEELLGDFDGTLIWIDNDAVVIDEPRELELVDSDRLAYVPVMHNRAGSLKSADPDGLWARIYELQSLTDESLFPMTTPVDGQLIRAYFHCGLLAVRPHSGILRGWAEDFERIYQDQRVKKLCEGDQTRKIFLHQHVLTGAILARVKRPSMRELSPGYNYPMLFDRQYQAPRAYNNLDEAVIIRRVVSRDAVGPDWDRQLRGPAATVAWLKDNIHAWH